MARAAIRATIRILALTTAGLALGACQMGSSGEGGGGGQVSRAETSVRLVERDVEAPQVFQAEDQALWDGRPSLGGVWVASPDAVDPERVILRNPANGKFVIGALFRRERMNPGPTLQISSDAAAALGILAGQPTRLSVTAMRREEVPDGPALAEAPAPILDSAETVETSTLAAAATAAIAKADGRAPSVPVVTAAMPAAAVAGAMGGTPATPAAAAPAPSTKAVKPAATPGKSNLIQIGIFSVEANAKRATGMLDKAGVTTRTLREETGGKVFWRVVAEGADRTATLTKVKAAGFADAYPVSR